MFRLYGLGVIMICYVMINVFVLLLGLCIGTWCDLLVIFSNAV